MLNKCTRHVLLLSKLVQSRRETPSIVHVGNIASSSSYSITLEDAKLSVAFD